MFEKIKSVFVTNKEVILSKGPIVLGAVLAVAGVALTIMIANQNQETEDIVDVIADEITE